MNIAMDATGDIDTSTNELLLVEGQEEIRQFSAQKLRTILGEWFLDVRLGVPYFQSIFTKRINPALADTIFINEIVTTPGIVELQEFDLNLDKLTRELSVAYRAQTIDGVVDFNEVVA